MQQVNHENWNSVVARDTAVLQFSAPWCGPCKNQTAIIDEVSGTKDNVFFGKVDIEQEMDIANDFKVLSVPTLVVLKNGKEQKRLVGFQSRQKLVEMLSCS